MSTECELGKLRPCYGEFRCSNCGRHWKSTKAWVDYGQNCKNCDTLVRPSKLSKNFVYICLDCPGMWHSSYSTAGSRCNNCDLFILPRDPDDLEDQIFIEAYKLRVREAGNIPNTNEMHDQELCEKCRVLGQPCRNATCSRVSMTTSRVSNCETMSKTNVSIDSWKLLALLDFSSQNLMITHLLLCGELYDTCHRYCKLSIKNKPTTVELLINTLHHFWHT